MVIVCVSLLDGCGSSQVTSGVAGPVGPAGAPGLVFAGPYDAKTEYKPTDVVTFKGSSFVAIAPSGNVAPTGQPASPSDWSLLAQAGVDGAQGEPGPAGPQGPVGALGPTGAAGPTGPVGSSAVATHIAISAIEGKTFGVLGDSISSLYQNAWQKVVIARTGMTLTFQDARPGRQFAQAFECWGNPPLGGPISSFNSAHLIFTGYSCSDESTGITNGETLSQSLAGVNLLIVELGTNDRGTSLGRLGDAANAGTYFGNMRWVVETYTIAKPTLRIVMVTCQYNSNPPATTQQYASATVEYANSMGLPVLNLYERGGVNVLNASSLLLDTVHPNPFAFQNFYGPTIAQFVMAQF